MLDGWILWDSRSSKVFPNLKDSMALRLCPCSRRLLGGCQLPSGERRAVQGSDARPVWGLMVAQSLLPVPSPDK